MTSQEYLKWTESTEATDYMLIKERVSTKLRLLHSLIGINTENGELQDQFKKHIFYGKSLDIVNIKEELGDLLWYIALALNSIDSTFEEVFELNRTKLTVRYDNKFSEAKATERNIAKEHEALDLPRIR